VPHPWGKLAILRTCTATVLVRKSYPKAEPECAAFLEGGGAALDMNDEVEGGGGTVWKLAPSRQAVSALRPLAVQRRCGGGGEAKVLQDPAPLPRGGPGPGSHEVCLSTLHKHHLYASFTLQPQANKLSAFASSMLGSYCKQASCVGVGCSLVDVERVRGWGEGGTWTLCRLRAGGTRSSP
jgi:hypothetical protein